MQLITFLGTGTYKPTGYKWGDEIVETPYVAEAICQFFQPDAVAVFVTQEAKAMHWEQLSNRLNGRFSAQDIPIPSGQSETEIWQIFDAVVDAVEPGSQVMFDITHAFRSIPMLVLLAAAFLQKARSVEIKGVYYGAFEFNNPQAPIVDLTPAIKLLDWLTATDKFIDTGSSAELGKLLSTIQQDFYTQKKQAELKPTKLKSFGITIENISRALDYVRPMGLLEEAAKLENIPAEKLQTEVGAFAKPFELILEQIQQDYRQFALANPREADPKTVLKQQFLLLRWYVDKGFGDRATLLAREWIVSMLCLAQDADYLKREDRQLVEYQLNLLDKWQQKKRDNAPMADYSPMSITKAVTDVEKLAKFWSNLTEFRNDLAHAEMRKESLSSATLKAYVNDKLMQGITALFPDMVG
ncbi:TIGR02221 family CRISPR-associated protein [[Phormidium] sp. ETS-05]|uniref:TIGR02221 family CRISPR-associated protein n=1 Tax=[Phormidium] sp. ETS-05 TaxID=222819 RepID=UPI0018EF1E55|nr:TIGR02221 family CRISPR-associated protein [[Phormidium] sp. ETS-05]